MLPRALQSVITVPYLQENLLILTDKRLYKLNIKKDDILKIIRDLNVNKAHGYDDIYIAMLKICDSVLSEPITTISKNYIDHGVFQDTWKCLILYKSIKRMINVLLMITAQFLLYIFVEKYLKETSVFERNICDIIYVQPNIYSFYNRIERVQYIKSAFAITSGIKGTYQLKI